ncbi:Ig-like domain-containing protein, partial [Maricaulis maris]|uniref:Ig-like domain-containing protein n=1 Tax=Maricaulis maris TaxID=74318 RepID=UPI003B8AA81E
GNGAASNFSATSATVYTATITPAADGTVTVDVAGSAAQDSAGNGNTAATQFSIENDETSPTVALTTGSADPVSGAFTITATFSEAVTGFAIGDLSVGNGAASNFSATSATVYTATITPAADGTVTVDVAAAAAQDSAGNGNVAATQFSIENDETGPTVALSTGSADPVSGAFTITATFSEAVTGFAIGDFSVGNGAASSFSAT